MRKLPFFIAIILGLTVWAYDLTIHEVSDYNFILHHYNHGVYRAKNPTFEKFSVSGLSHNPGDTIYYNADTLDILLDCLMSKYDEKPSKLQKEVLMCYSNDQIIRVMNLSELEFICMIEHLTSTKIHREKSEFNCVEGCLYSHISKYSMDSLYLAYKSNRNRITKDILWDYIENIKYLYVWHNWDHPWHLFNGDDEELCPTYDSLKCEFANLRKRVQGLETVNICSKGYSLYEDSTISIEEKIDRFEQKLAYLGASKGYFAEGELESLKSSLQHTIDSLKCESNIK